MDKFKYRKVFCYKNNYSHIDGKMLNDYTFYLESELYDLELKHKAIKQGDNALDVAKQIPQVAQTQIALNEQLKILRVAANKLGLYDAADFIKCD